jgi:hypothetical protein
LVRCAMAVFSVHPMSAMSIVLPLASLPPQPEVRMPKIMSKKKPRKAAFISLLASSTKILLYS